LRAALAGVAVLALVVTGCGGGNDTTNAPADTPTLPPVSAFKDGLLYAAVKARLAGSDIDSTTRISVFVHSGVVTLRGPVPDRDAKARDVALVRGMRGVKVVHDELTIGHLGPSAAQAVGDVALVAAVESSLAAQAGVNVTGVRVRANAGTVTLTGRAPTAAIKSTLVAAAQKTPGVRNVIDRIAVR
jgi:osmotically-inducible protein OsmY